MANGTNQTISTLIERQLPEFVRQNGPMFQAFLENYYAYLEQGVTDVASGKVIDRAKGLLDNADIDTAIDGFAQKMYLEFLAYFPQDAQINKGFILKNIKDFYRGRGSEQSYRFLFRALYGKESSVYFPKTDILIVSNGKWQIDKSLKVTNITVNGVVNNTAQGALFFVNTLVKGNNSTATAAVERTTTAFVNNALVFELFVSGVVGAFIGGEVITTTDFNGNVISATLYSGQVTKVTIVKGGTRYNIGDPVIFSPPPGLNPAATGFVSNVTSGNVSSIVTTYGGAGYNANNPLSITSGTGSGATGHVISVDTTGTQNCGPSSYNVVFSLVGDLANIALNANSYNIANAVLGWTNANTTLANSLFFVTLTNIGPILTVSTDNQGAGYLSPPSVSAVANTRLTNLGAIGRLRIVSPGTGYQVGDYLQFTNVLGGLGYGANAIVLANSAPGGGISQVQMNAFDVKADQFVGGSGYDQFHFPTITVISSNAQATGANIVCADILGTDATFNVQTGAIGAIQQITITGGGTNYNVAPSINLQGSGDGTAQAYSNIITGAFTYPGRYTDDSSTISTHSFLEDRDYYQNFAYDVKVPESIETYRLPVKNMVHPAGMKLWGSYLYGGSFANTVNLSVNSADVNERTDQHFYIANATIFQGNSYMNSATAMTPSSGKQGTLSLWLNFSTMPPAGSQSLIRMGNLFLNIVNTAVPNTYSTYFQILGQNVTTTLLDIRSNTRDVFMPNTWINLLATWDLTVPTANLYLTNVASLNVITLISSANSFISYNIANSSVGYNNIGESWSEIWLSNTWVNLSNVNNRVLFVTSYLQPANLASNGSGPTGAQPLIYLNNTGPTANVNDGTGGNFTFQGTIIQANSSPTDI